MSQQMSIFDFYKSVNPKCHSSSKKQQKPAEKNNLKKRSRPTSSQPKKKPQTPTRTMKTPSNLSEINNGIDLVDLIDSGEESKPPKREIKEERRTSRDFSREKSLPRSPENSNRKRQASEPRSGSSPRKKSQTNGARSVTKHLKHRSQRRLFQNESIDAGKVSDVIENLNLSRAGIFPKNDYDLETFYSEVERDPDVLTFDIEQISLVYDANRVVIPREKHAEHFFGLITHVFSNPSNCGYFDDQELDMVFNILSLSEKAQSLFARIVKRKHCWRKSTAFDYPEIHKELRPYFDELEQHGLITSDMDNESLETLLTMLSADELRDICRQSKIPKQGNKDLAIKQLLKTSCIKSLFPGAESPATVLRKAVLTTLNHCVCLKESVINLIDRIVALFIPSEDPTTSLSDIFLRLTMTKEGSLRFPEVSVQNCPVFQNREHLLRYVERRNELRKALEVPKGPKENWEMFKTLGREAHYRLLLLLGDNRSSQKDSPIPRHVQKFREEYVCVKIVTTCLEVFKKESTTIEEAVAMLKNLINQDRYMQSRKAEWYEELALIEMKHRKDLEAAAIATIEGLALENITENGEHLLTRRAAILAKRKSGLKADMKSVLKNLSSKEVLKNTPVVSINANVLDGNLPGRKSTWSMEMEGGDKGYMSVEGRAQYYYRKNGYPESWHCEGSLPTTLFTLLFWEELYRVSVPAAYLSPYQTAPLDLFTSDFYNNRKEHLEKRMELVGALSADELASLIAETIEIKQHYSSLMPTTLPVNSEQIRAIVRCMGTKVVIGICQRLASNFCGWRAGFPDLLVWNSATLECKFVEVKGPGDTLSSKQTLWLRYLESLGAATELCEVKDSRFVDSTIRNHNASACGIVFVQGPEKWYLKNNDINPQRKNK